MEKLKVYFAGPYDARSSLKQLVQEAPPFIESTARWLTTHYDPDQRRVAALHDLEDVKRADAFVVAVAQRGWGHAVELGYALAQEIPIIVIDEEGGNPDWNVFLHLPQLVICRSWTEAMETLENIHVFPLDWRPWKVGDYVQDGGEWGTIIRCKECGGSGQLHRLDEQPKTANPQDAGLTLHPSTKMFRAILDEVWELHVRKSIDYGTETDPLQNLRSATEFGVPNWIGASVRANDKVQRIKAGATRALQRGEVAMGNESIIDAFRDASNYFILIEILFREWLHETGQDRVGDEIDAVRDRALSLPEAVGTTQEGQGDEEGEGLEHNHQVLQSLTGASTSEESTRI